MFVIFSFSIIVEGLFCIVFSVFRSVGCREGGCYVFFVIVGRRCCFRGGFGRVGCTWISEFRVGFFGWVGFGDERR